MQVHVGRISAASRSDDITWLNAFELRLRGQLFDVVEGGNNLALAEGYEL
jgi:hypothetical protein